MAANWSEAGRKALAEIAGRQGFGLEAAKTLAEAMVAGCGRMAQFGHPELGGMGQWSRGGMLMIGDMFNSGLKARVGSLADDLAAALADGSLVVEAAPSVDAGLGDVRPQGNSQAWAGLRSASAPRLGGQAWWPRHLGAPGSSGAQNGRRYAIFPSDRRLAVEQDGEVRLYDTGEHRIGGIAQAQGDGDSLRFSSQLGSIDLADLAEVDAPHIAPSPQQDRQPPNTTAVGALRSTDRPRLATAADFSAVGPGRIDAPAQSLEAAGADVIDTIRRLAELRDQNILSPEEFAAKKAELLGRL